MFMWKFLKDEDGAVTVDWVVLTATIGLLGVAVQVGMGTATKNASDKISTKVASVDVLFDF